MVVRDLLIRGLLAGLLAGVLALGVAGLLGEPQVSRAIAVETQLYQQQHKPAEPVIVSRDVQSTVGLATGVLVVGTALGGLFALGFAFAYGRIGSIGPRVTALAVAGAGFVAVYLVPFLKYPPNPPSVGQPATLDHRTELYFGLMVISVLTVLGAIIVGRRLAPRFGTWNAALLTAGAFIAVTAAIFAVMPGLNEVPPGFPATTLWQFRIASLATQLTMWTAIGLVFGALTDRSPADGRRTARQSARVVQRAIEGRHGVKDLRRHNVYRGHG
ncbi:MAG: CbtA family protein [Actinomycetota bacterium]|nr:CbtA family protein [Actinomycetota bacterium]